MGRHRARGSVRAPRLLLLTMQPGQTDEHVIEVTLAADGDQIILVWEERGMPPDLLAAYGAGIQVHVEDLAAHLAGRERCDAGARWNELIPAYQDLATPESGDSSRVVWPLFGSSGWIIRLLRSVLPGRPH